MALAASSGPKGDPPPRGSTSAVWILLNSEYNYPRPTLKPVANCLEGESDRLDSSSFALEELAERTGYGSEAAFSTAFKREMGIAPGAYRRNRTKIGQPL